MKNGQQVAQLAIACKTDEERLEKAQQPFVKPLPEGHRPVLAAE